jgi:hypothetical protein
MGLPSDLFPLHDVSDQRSFTSGQGKRLNPKFEPEVRSLFLKKDMGPPRFELGISTLLKTKFNLSKPKLLFNVSFGLNLLPCPGVKRRGVGKGHL